MIRVSDLHIEYPWQATAIKAVNGVSFDVNDNDYIALVGPAGSGKSTIMAAIAGLIFPRKGDINVDKFHVNKMSRAKRAKLRANYFSIVFQFSDMISRFTVEENMIVSWHSRNGDLHKQKFKERKKYLCDALEMTDLLKARPTRLSGGQLQKAAIATALIKDAPVILADEPSGDLDPYSSELLQKLIKNENEAGKSVILITHNMELAFDAKTVFEIVDGKVLRVMK